MISLRNVKLADEAAPHRVRPVLSEERDLHLLNHVVVEEAEKEGDRHALAGRYNRGDNLKLKDISNLTNYRTKTTS